MPHYNSLQRFWVHFRPKRHITIGINSEDNKIVLTNIPRRRNRKPVQICLMLSRNTQYWWGPWIGTMCKPSPTNHGWRHPHHHPWQDHPEHSSWSDHRQPVFDSLAYSTEHSLLEREHWCRSQVFLGRLESSDNHLGIWSKVVGVQEHVKQN